MVSSFRVTFVDFLNQRLAPELFVEVENVAQSQSLSNYLARTNRETLPLVFTTQLLAGKPSIYSALLWVQLIVNTGRF